MDEQISHQRFTDLHVWKQARELKLTVYELVKQFPEGEKFKLTDQVIRSSRSICANLSEGHGRFTYKDQINFCIMSRGSLSETLNHLIDAYDCNYINKETLQSIEQKYTIIEKLLNGYITFLRNSGNSNSDNKSR